MSPGDTTAHACGRKGVPRQSHKETQTQSLPGACASLRSQGSGPKGHPISLTSPGPGLVGDPWEPETREKGLRGLVRLAELRGLAGLLELYVPEGPMATAENKGIPSGPPCAQVDAAVCLMAPGFWAVQGMEPTHLCAWPCLCRGMGCSSSAPPSHPGSARSPSGSAGSAPRSAEEERQWAERVLMLSSPQPQAMGHMDAGTATVLLPSSMGSTNPSPSMASRGSSAPLAKAGHQGLSIELPLAHWLLVGSREWKEIGGFHLHGDGVGTTHSPGCPG